MSASVPFSADLLPLVFQWLDEGTLKSCRLVCQLWNQEITKGVIFNFSKSWREVDECRQIMKNLRKSPTLPCIRNICLPPTWFELEEDDWDEEREEIFGTLTVLRDQLHTVGVGPRYDKALVLFKFLRPYRGGDLVEDLKRFFAVTTEKSREKVCRLLGDPLHKTNSLWSNVAKFSFDDDFFPSTMDLYLDLCVNLESVFIDSVWDPENAEEVVPKLRGALGLRLREFGYFSIIPELQSLCPQCNLVSLVIDCKDSWDFYYRMPHLLDFNWCSNLESLCVIVDWYVIGKMGGNFDWPLFPNLKKLKRLRIESNGYDTTAVSMEDFIKCALELPRLDTLDLVGFAFGNSSRDSSGSESQEWSTPILSQSFTLRTIKWECHGRDEDGLWAARLFSWQPNPWPNVERLTLGNPTAAMLSAVFRALPRLKSLELSVEGCKYSRVLPWESIFVGGPIPEPQSHFAPIQILPGSARHFLTNLKGLKSIKVTISWIDCACWKLTDFFITDVLLALKELQHIEITGHKFTNVAMKELREEFHPLTAIVYTEAENPALVMFARLHLHPGKNDYQNLWMALKSSKSHSAASDITSDRFDLYFRKETI